MNSLYLGARNRAVVELCGLAVALSGLVSASGCNATAAATDTAAESDAGSDTTTGPAQAADPTKQQPSEWVSFALHMPLPSDWDAMASGLFGDNAAAGKFQTERQIATGYWIAAAAEATTPDQSRITLQFAKPDGKTRRTLAVVPASFAIGKVWLQTVRAAMAKMTADAAKDPAGAERFLLEYHVLSTQGGMFNFGVEGNAGVFTLHITVSSPRTSLVPEVLGHALQSASAFDSIAGTVWFHLNKDDFDFFVDHAYGAGATSKQNFSDFRLFPHNWLRLTVTPHLDQKFVDVGFEVVTLDNQRIAVAKAPASILAGAAFQELVLHNMGTMLDAEDAAPGSSLPWDSTFYYDHPDGGGVVNVVAHGEKGKFNIAYAVETPQHALADVPFQAWPDVVFPAKDPKADATCDQLGDPTITLAAQGTLNMTFMASKFVLESKELKVPLKATIRCSIFHASDVTVAGPNDGVKSLQDFNMENADLQAATAPTFTSQLLTAGQYQVLCAQDLDNSGDASKGDPVTLPIGGQEVACNKNPVVIEFGLLNPN
jgi:hypothetical protein